MQRGRAGLHGDFFPVRRVLGHPPERAKPRADVLFWNIRDGHHVFIQRGLILRYRIYGYEIRNSELRFFQSTYITRYHGDASEHSFQHHTRPCLGPKRWHQQKACMAEKIVEIVHRIDRGDIRMTAELSEIVSAGSPRGHGREFQLRGACGEREEYRDSFYRAGIHHNHVGIVETSELGYLSRLQQRNGDVYCMEAAPLPYVPGHILADAHNSVSMP